MQSTSYAPQQAAPDQCKLDLSRVQHLHDHRRCLHSNHCRKWSQEQFSGARSSYAFLLHAALERRWFWPRARTQLPYAFWQRRSTSFFEESAPWQGIGCCEQQRVISSCMMRHLQSAVPAALQTLHVITHMLGRPFVFKRIDDSSSAAPTLLKQTATDILTEDSMND